MARGEAGRTHSHSGPGGRGCAAQVQDAGSEIALDSGHTCMVESTASVQSGCRRGRRNGEKEEGESHRGHHDLEAEQPEGRSDCELL